MFTPISSLAATPGVASITITWLGGGPAYRVRTDDQVIYEGTAVGLTDTAVTPGESRTYSVAAFDPGTLEEGDAASVSAVAMAGAPSNASAPRP